MLRIFKYFLSVLIVGFVPFALLVQAQNQSGFISLDCGLPETSGYSEEKTGINFISDATSIDTGESKFIQQQTDYKPYWYLRSFPEGIRNCYNINVTYGTKYLIRASFLYGNYDGQSKSPEFELHLGPHLWDVVNFTFSFSEVSKEIIHIPVEDYIQLCLVKTTEGVPFISVIELRPLPITAYNVDTERGSLLALVSRYDTGPGLFDTLSYTKRYPIDIHDRIWETDSSSYWTELNTSSDMFQASNQNSLQLPPLVMSTAATPKNASDALDFYWLADDNSTTYWLYLHFAEVEKLQPNQSRQFNISLDEEHFYGPLTPNYLKTNTIFGRMRGSKFDYSVSIFKVGNSTLPPILNSYEVYKIKKFMESETHQVDVDTMANIKSTYKITKISWQGDPCSPQNYSWEGLTCSYNETDPPRIISLNLSSSGLTGEITPSIFKLKMLRTLDLSNNILKGPIPDFSFQLPNLHALNLEKNNLTGPVPDGLLAKMANGSLELSLCENPDVYGLASCKKKKKHSFFIPILVSIVGVSVVLLTGAAIWWGYNKKKKQGDATDAKATVQLGSLKSRKINFTYSEIVKITNNFERVLGEGGFGKVYHGYIDNSQVAIKMLSPSSLQGFQQFEAEVDLLMRVHHKMLTSLVGYCNDKTNKGLIYEYMANGNLRQRLSDTSSNILTLEDRLRIAADAAQGLEYLHHGCKPPIIHRDVKTTNILLNENFQAKLSDFGLSKVFPSNAGTHVSTVAAGTPGYLDPEYYQTNRLTEKSDVYSFGIVLLEIVTSRPVPSRVQDPRSLDRIHISRWVALMLEKGEIYGIVDPKLGRNFNVNSAWKAVEIAMACVSPESIKRPKMNQVVAELKECLITGTNRSPREEFGYPTEIVPENSIAMLAPSLR